MANSSAVAPFFLFPVNTCLFSQSWMWPLSTLLSQLLGHISFYCFLPQLGGPWYAHITLQRPSSPYWHSRHQEQSHKSSVCLPLAVSPCVATSVPEMILVLDPVMSRFTIEHNYSVSFTRYMGKRIFKKIKLTSG